jgi:hypothetical protein
MHWNYRIIDGKLCEVYYQQDGTPKGFCEANFVEPLSPDFYEDIEGDLQSEKHGDVLVFSDFKQIHGLEGLASLDPKIIPPARQPRDRNQIVEDAIDEYCRAVKTAWKQAVALPPLSSSDF